MLSQDYLKQRLDYDPETGIFTWKEYNGFGKYWNVKFAGKKAGCINPEGYVHIFLNNKKYFAHRIAWVYVYGNIEGQIDHIDRDKSNNKIDNLRVVTQTENNLNRKALPNKTGYKHVSLTKHGTFRVTITRGRNGVSTHVGTFKTLEDAVNARDLYLNND